jgi:3D (Asp-Asp-Asp) domain-containing protein
MKKYLMGLAVGLLAGCCILLGWQFGRDAKDAKAADLPQMEEVMPQIRQQEAPQTQEQTFTVTAYCPCEKCCGAYANGYTATGEKATQGVTVAADPDVLPMGTEIELDGHTYTVQDTGDAIAGNRLDLYFDSHEDALRWGVREKIVRWAE